MKTLNEALDILKQNRRLYLTLNGVYYGIIVVALAYSQFDRSLHNQIIQAIGATYGAGGPLASITDAYLNGKIVQAISVTLGVNLVVGSFASITLPSLIIPFSGLAIAVYRAALWGIIFSPESGFALTGQSLISGVLVTGLLLLEGQGYVLSMLGAVLQGRAFVSPRSVGEESRPRAYLAGLKLTLRVYLLIIIVLFVSAIYEVLVVVLMPH
jgi:hypothetical protein